MGDELPEIQTSPMAHEVEDGEACSVARTKTPRPQESSRAVVERAIRKSKDPMAKWDFEDVKEDEDPREEAARDAAYLPPEVSGT
jgi:hypothetical protein